VWSAGDVIGPICEAAPMGGPPGDSLWRHRDFLMLWGGQSVSRLGSQVSLLALPLLAIAGLHVTTLQVGLLSASATVPFLLMGLSAGVVVDRLPRRREMIAGDAGRALVLASISIPIAWAAGVLTMAQLFVVALVSGVLTVFIDVDYQSYLPDLIAAPQLVDGNGELATTESLAQVAGLAAAGALVQVVGAAPAMLVDAVSFAASALALLGLRVAGRRPPAPAVGRASRPRRLLSEVGEGLPSSSMNATSVRSPPARRRRISSVA